MTAKALGFDRPMANSLDAVSDRDFVLETLSAAAITAVHLSRFAEEIVIWCSPLVGPRLRCPTASPPAPRSCRRSAIRTPPSWCAPRPDASSARSQALLIVMKGLPLAYQKDMQEDKEGAMDALSALTLSIAAMTGMVRDMTPDVGAHARGRGRGLFDRDRSRRLAGAHAEDAVPRGAPRHRPDRGQGGGRRASPLHDLPLAAMQAIEPRITKDVFAVLSVDNSVKSRVSYGGTAPKNVRREANRWLKALAKVRR